MVRYALLHEAGCLATKKQVNTKSTCSKDAHTDTMMDARIYKKA